MIKPAVANGISDASLIDEDEPRDMEAFKRSMRRFAAGWAELPVAMQATCPSCGRVVGATFDRIGRQIVLTCDCPRCGTRREVHHDRIWTRAAGDYPGGATETFCGSRVRPCGRWYCGFCSWAPSSRRGIGGGLGRPPWS